MSISIATKSAIMSPKVLTLVVVVLISLMCGTVICDAQSAGISQSNNSSLSQSSSSQSGSVPGASPEKNSDASLSHVFAHSDATAPKAKPGAKPAPVNASKSDCGTEPCVPNAKTAPSNSSSVLPNEAEGIVHAGDDSDDSKKMNPEALMRGFYVFLGLSVIVIAYIAWKSFGKRPAQVHRYGVVGNRDDLEMAPLDSDEADDDDTTHFDISSHRLKT